MLPLQTPPHKPIGCTPTECAALAGRILSAPDVSGRFVRSSAFTRPSVVDSPNRPAAGGTELQTGAVKGSERLPSSHEQTTVVAMPSFKARWPVVRFFSFRLT